ncbi:hypothetical protein Hypma_013357 [Hypsizygus marmoreus]|uniref:Uncharacterized protein n=1 Tax=Hypsizygus marmoreus TaxID=39966 RepID=A0A369JIL1_HYPMA|nr:hypothetical protein Hypma_013357 [Hypsizygus marmoreus]
MPRTKQTAQKLTRAPMLCMALGAAIPKEDKTMPMPDQKNRQAERGLENSQNNEVHTQNNIIILDCTYITCWFCSNCKNGRLLMECSSCLRALCKHYMEVPKTMLIEALFTCTYCHLHSGNAQNNKIAPYMGLSTMKTLLTIHGSIIIFLRLATIPSAGSSAMLVYHDLYPYISKGIALMKLEYDLQHLVVSLHMSPK